MSDRQIKKAQWAEAAMARAATLVPLAAAAASYFSEREKVLVEHLVQAQTDGVRAELAHELRALRNLKAWLLMQEVTGKQAEKELELVR